MHCDLLTLFPELIQGGVSHSIIKRSQEKGLVQIEVHNIRDYIDDRHRVADDAPYGGGAGMVMKAEPIFRVVDALRKTGDALRMIMPSPQGKLFNQSLAKELSQDPRRLVWVCGHYEGIDERVMEWLQPEEISIGDYVVTGGELPALVMIDAAIRLIPGVVGDPESVAQDSFMESLLDFPHYTRPEGVRGVGVPDVLLSGNHQSIRQWRRKAALKNTYQKRPDLLNQALLSEEDQQLLKEIIQEGHQELSVSQREE